jgi:hypothetical protein
VSTALYRVVKSNPRRQILIPFETSPCHLVGGQSYSLGLSLTGKPAIPDPRSFEVREPGRLSEEIVLSLGVPSLVDNLVTLELSPALAYGFTEKFDSRLRSPPSSSDL